MTVECRNVQMSKILLTETQVPSDCVLALYYFPQTFKALATMTASILTFLGFYEPSECKWINTKQLLKKYTQN